MSITEIGVHVEASDNRTLSITLTNIPFDDLEGFFSHLGTAEGQLSLAMAMYESVDARLKSSTPDDTVSQ